MHDRLVRLVFKVAIPTALEMWRRPLLHLGEFLLSRTNLDTSFDAISSQRSSALEVPFIKDCFLDLWNAADEVVEAFRVCCHQHYYKMSGVIGLTGLGTIGREREVVVLEVQTDARKVDDRLDARLLQLLGVTDTAALEDEW